MMIQTKSGHSKTLYRSASGSTVTQSPPSIVRLRTRLPSHFYRPPVLKNNGSGTSSHSSGHRQNKPRRQKLWSPWKLMLFSVFLGMAGTFYLAHVYQTQNILREVQQLRREYERVQRIHADTRRNYDRAIGPAEIYSQAERLGMISGGATDPVIFID